MRGLPGKEDLLISTRRSVFIAVFLATAVTAEAQFSRTAVSVNGNDANPCTVASPCRSFSRAISQTIAGGEVIAVDSGGYGPFSVNAAVAVLAAPGVTASMSVQSGNGVFVNAAANDRVFLRNLQIRGVGGATGIQYVSGGQLIVEGVTIVGMTSQGIDVSGTSDLRLQLRDSLIVDSVFNVMLETTTGIADALIERTVSSGGSNAYRADSNSRLVLRDSAAVHGTYGVMVNCGTGTCNAVIENSVIHGQSLTGIRTGGLSGTASARVSNSTITANGLGVGPVSPSTLLTRSNNTFGMNGSDGSFTGTFSGQ